MEEGRGREQVCVRVRVRVRVCVGVGVGVFVGTCEGGREREHKQKIIHNIFPGIIMTDDFQIFRAPFLAVTPGETKTVHFLHLQFGFVVLKSPGLDSSILFLDQSFCWTPPELVLLAMLTFLDGTIKDETSLGASTI